MTTEPLGPRLARLGEKMFAAPPVPVHGPDPARSERVSGLAAIAEARRDEMRREALAAQWETLVPRRYRTATIGDYDEPMVREQLCRWQRAWHDGVNLVVTGPTGTGKTHAAFASVRDPFFDGVRFGFWPIKNLTRAIDYQVPGHQDRLKEIIKVPVLVLDDFGVGATSDWLEGELYGIVNDRYQADRATIITTNLDRDGLAAVGDRIVGRLAQSSVGVRLSGEDRRRGQR